MGPVRLTHSLQLSTICGRQWLADALKENDPSNVLLFLVGSKKDLSVSVPVGERSSWVRGPPPTSPSDADFILPDACSIFPNGEGCPQGGPRD